jgi:hypothetical protein
MPAQPEARIVVLTVVIRLLFQFEVPADSFMPGLYTCQINIIDTVAGKFEFPRMLFVVR